MSHYIKKCKECEGVIAQCRCPDGNKKTTYGICNDCKKGKETGIPIGLEYL
jgi:hypothetical protein